MNATRSIETSTATDPDDCLIRRLSSDTAQEELAREMRESDKTRDFLSCRVGSCALACSVRRVGNNLHIVGTPRYQDCLEGN